MNNKIVAISIAAVIGIIVLGSVLMPIMNDATATTDTFTNEGYYHMTSVDSDDSDVTIVWALENKNIITIDGETIDMSTLGLTSGLSYDVAFSLTGPIMRYVNGTSNQYIQLMVGNGNGGGSSTTKSVTLVLSEGTGTFTLVNDDNTTSTKTFSYDTVYYIDTTASSNLVMKKADKSAYLNADSEIIACGVTAANNYALNVFTITGSIEEDFTITNALYEYGKSALTISNENVDYSEVNDHKDLYALNKITFTATGDVNSTDCTYSYFLVPNEVSAERSVHFTAGQNAIFAAIPVMIILAVLLGVVALVIRSRMD